MSVYFIKCHFIFLGLQHRQNHGANGARTSHSGGLKPEPFFETVQDPETGHGGRNITTAEGGKAVLLCTIRHLGKNNTVRNVVVNINNILIW